MKLASTDVKKIAVFRALQLGDMLCVIPAIRALRQAYPTAEILLLGLPWARTFTDRFDNYFTGFIHFPGFPGLPEQEFDPHIFPRFLRDIQSSGFDLVLQLQGNGTLVNPLMELFDARYTAGFCTSGHYAPDNELFLAYPDEDHEITRHVKLMQHLGIPPAGYDLEFPLRPADYQEFQRLDFGIEPKKYVCIHPGSRGSWRQWPVEYFAKLADYVTELGFKVVVTGTSEEQEIVDSMISRMHYTPINASGKTSLGCVAVLVRNAALLISNCTGVSHIAAAFKTPSIVLSMDGEPHRWAPMDKAAHRTINWLETPDFDLVFRQTGELMEQLAWTVPEPPSGRFQQWA